MPFDIAQCIEDSRRYLATEYLHHKRMTRQSAGHPGEGYHRNYMRSARRRFLALAKEARP